MILVSFNYGAKANRTGYQLPVIDQYRGKWEAPELREKLIEFYEKHRDKPGSYIKYIT